MTYKFKGQSKIKKFVSLIGTMKRKDFSVLKGIIRLNLVAEEQERGWSNCI